MAIDEFVFVPFVPAFVLASTTGARWKELPVKLAAEDPGRRDDENGPKRQNLLGSLQEVIRSSSDGVLSWYSFSSHGLEGSRGA